MTQMEQMVSYHHSHGFLFSLLYNPNFFFWLHPQNKEFVCRGHDYERLEAFQQRMLNEFPHAIAMQHANQPDETIFQAEAQCIHSWWAPVGWYLLLAAGHCPGKCCSHCSLFSGPPLRLPRPCCPDFSLVPSEQNVTVTIVITESVGRKCHKHLVRNFLPFDCHSCKSTLLSISYRTRFLWLFSSRKW